jgi:hypothetical protein
MFVVEKLLLHQLKQLRTIFKLDQMSISNRRGTEDISKDEGNGVKVERAEIEKKEV